MKKTKGNKMGKSCLIIFAFSYTAASVGLRAIQTNDRSIGLRVMRTNNRTVGRSVWAVDTHTKSGAYIIISNALRLTCCL